MKRRWLGCALVALLWCGPPGFGSPDGGETEVQGTGFGASARPPETNAPPEGYGEEHDPDEGLPLDGLDDYDLLQGGEPDDKGTWQKTDYVRWEVHAATLLGEGQATDRKPDKTTEASGDGWGAELVDASIGADEGAWGVIHADNRIGFAYSYSISGQDIGEGSVRLMGTAFDIEGRDHHFTLHAESGESVTEDTEVEVGLDYGTSSELSVGLSDKGASVAAGSKSALGLSYRIMAHVSRRCGHAVTGNGATDNVQVSDEVSGATPLSKKYEVFSDGSIALTARGGAFHTLVVVRVERFDVLNSLRVFKQAFDSAPGPEPGTPSRPGGPTTGGDDPPPPVEPPPDGGPTTGDGEDASGDDSGRAPLPGLDGCSAHPDVVAPRGLGGEPGAQAGRIRVGLDRPAPRDVVFAVETGEGSPLDLGGADRLVVRAGRQWGSVACHGRDEGVSAVTLRLLDEAGGPTDWTETVLIETTSTAGCVAPRLWAALRGTAHVPGQALFAERLAGGEPEVLRIGRTGFLGYATDATVVGVEVEDPAGLLGPLPATVTIPAGAEEVELPLPAPEIAGEARVLLTTPDDTVSVALRFRAQAWSSIARVRIPVGAVAPVPFLLAAPERTDRPVAAEDCDAALLAPAAAGPATVRAGERAWFVPLRGLAAGSTTVTLTSPGLEPLRVPVDVVAPDIVVADGRLRLLGLDMAGDGTVRLAVPDGMTITALESPAEAADFLAVEGIGTSAVTLQFTPSPDIPESLSLPIGIESGGRPVALTVIDLRGDGQEEEPFNSYTIDAK